MNKGKADSLDFLDDGWAFHFSYLLFISLLIEYTDIIDKKGKKFRFFELFLKIFQLF